MLLPTAAPSAIPSTCPYRGVSRNKDYVAQEESHGAPTEGPRNPTELRGDKTKCTQAEGPRLRTVVCRRHTSSLVGLLSDMLALLLASTAAPGKPGAADVGVA
eukprot:Rmarinus@m.23364